MLVAIGQTLNSSSDLEGVYDFPKSETKEVYVKSRAFQLDGAPLELGLGVLTGCYWASY